MQYPYEKDEHQAVNTLLYSKRSTTTYFKKICPDGFNLVVLNKQWQAAHAIGLPLLLQHIKDADNALVFVRDVLLRCHDRNLMYAQTLFPADTIAAHPVFADLETRSLGEILYQDPQLTRDYLSVKKIYPRDSAYKGIQPYLTGASEFIWMRQSKICFYQAPLFMYEVFLPDLLDPLRVHGMPTCLTE